VSAQQRLKTAFRKVGVEVARYRPAGVRRSGLLRSAGIASVIDVGANVGQYASELRANGFAGQIVSFEPLAAAYEALEQAARDDPQWQTHRLALGDRAGTATLNVAANAASSSLRAMLPAHEEAGPSATMVSTEEVEVARLDEVGGIPDLPGPVLLKLDVQGFEDAVLRGAPETLRGAGLLEVETSVRSLYDHQPLLTDILIELRSSGFDLIALEPGFYDPRDGATLQFDAFFVPGTGDQPDSPRRR
jgi:FkbM family methyltransferase